DRAAHDRTVRDRAAHDRAVRDRAVHDRAARNHHIRRSITPDAHDPHRSIAIEKLTCAPSLLVQEYVPGPTSGRKNVSNQAIKDLIKKVHADPHLLDDLLNAGTGRGNKLKAQGATFKRKDVMAEMIALLTSSGGSAPNGRLVEWVGAI